MKDVWEGVNQGGSEFMKGAPRALLIWDGDVMQDDFNLTFMEGRNRLTLLKEKA